METLKSLRLFAQVARSESFSAAGRTLGLSPASVSRQIQALEDQLGAALFNRTSRRISLTEAGDLYLQRVSQILVGVDDAAEAVAELHSTPKGGLTVHARSSIAVKHIAPYVAEFLNRHPGLTIRFILSDGDVDLLRDGIDISIKSGRLIDSSLKARKLSEGLRLIAASPAYIARHGQPLRPEDLGRHNCLTYPLDLATPVWRFRGRGDDLEFEVSGNFVANNADMLRTATLAGLGVSLLPEWLIGEDLARGDLVPLITEYEASNLTFDHGIFAVYQPARWRSAKVRLFVEFLVELFRRHADWRSSSALARAPATSA